jgi:hypothetical protein
VTGGADALAHDGDGLFSAIPHAFVMGEDGRRDLGGQLGDLCLFLRTEPLPLISRSYQQQMPDKFPRTGGIMLGGGRGATLRETTRICPAPVRKFSL